MISKLTGRLRERVPDDFIQQARKLAPLGAFTGGFTWDSLTLTRVDSVLDNAILLTYLLLLGLSIVLMYLTVERMEEQAFMHEVYGEEGTERPSFIRRFRGWYPNLIQFFMGGLFSSYVVFYFHSASMSRTLVFVLLLFGLLVANEFLKDSLRNIYLTIGLYFFVSFAFFTFSIPVITKHFGYLTFLASGLVSLALVSAICFWLFRARVLSGRRQMWVLIAQSMLILVLLNGLYKLNWIPPVPLSVKQAGIYHSVERTGDSYALSYAKPRWYRFWQTSDTLFLMREGDRAYCFSSVFAPSELKTDIYHHWSFYDTKNKEWTQTDRISLKITGGRYKGWRTYTRKSHIMPGRWKVDIRTEGGQMLGQISFRVVEARRELKFLTDNI
jgi:hypothetical protein